jgi:hypothetical protein
MPVNFYPQKTEAELVEILKGLQVRQGKGALTEVAAAGQRVYRQVLLWNNSRVEVEIKRVLYALNQLNPEVYSDPYAGMLRRTRTRYTFS